MADAVVYPTLYQKTCTRCGEAYKAPYRRAGLCPDCVQWMKDTKYTHCHKALCCDPANPTMFDKVQDSGHGKEYHCPKCGSCINFDLLAEVFSVERKR